MLSIIIPTYNAEKYIGDTLSLLKTSLDVGHRTDGDLGSILYEIIVSDDTSSDTTVSIAKKYADKVLSQSKKFTTIAQNRNTGARSAQGDIFVFMDDDSKIYDAMKFFNIAIKRFEDDPELVALTSDIKVIPSMETFADKTIYVVFNFVHKLKNNVFHVGEASGKFQMIRRSAFERLGGYREDLVTREDGDMFARLSKIGKARLEPSLTVYHTGRRAHVIGWPKLLSIWMINTLWVAIFNTSKSKEWLPKSPKVPKTPNLL